MAEHGHRTSGEKGNRKARNLGDVDCPSGLYLVAPRGASGNLPLLSMFVCESWEGAIF